MSEFNLTYQSKQVASLNDFKLFTDTWYSIWLEEGYAMSTDAIRAKYAQYNSVSVDYLLKHDEHPVGTMRIVNNTAATGLPVLNDFLISRSFAEEKLCEATLLTVKQCERGGSASLMLLCELWKYVRENGISGIVIAADSRLWVLLTQKLKLRFTQMGTEKLYEGSLTLPGYLNVNEQKAFALQTAPRNILEETFYQY